MTKYLYYAVEYIFAMFCTISLYIFLELIAGFVILNDLIYVNSGHSPFTQIVYRNLTTHLINHELYLPKTILLSPDARYWTEDMLKAGGTSEIIGAQGLEILSSAYKGAQKNGNYGYQ